MKELIISNMASSKSLENLFNKNNNSENYNNYIIISDTCIRNVGLKLVKNQTNAKQHPEVEL